MLGVLNGKGAMASTKKGQLTRAREWWKHLRRTKRDFWKGERRAAKGEARREADLREASERRGS